MNLLHTGGKLFLGTAVYDMYLSAEAEGCTGRVHSHVSAADDCHLVALRDRGIVIFIKGLHQVISGQILVGGEYAAGGLARDSHELRKSRAGTDEYGVKAFLLHQLVDGDGLSYDHVGLNLHAQRFHILHLGKHDAVLGKTELRNAVYQHAACLVQSLEDGHVIAQLRQIAGTGQTCGAGTDDGYLLAVLLRGSRRLDALLSRPVGHETLQLSDGNRLALDAADAASLALALLGTYTSADSRKGGGLADDTISLREIAFLYRLDKIRNMDLHRAAFHTFCLLTVQAASGLFHRLVFIISQADLVKVRRADLRILLSYRYFL